MTPFTNRHHACALLLLGLLACTTALAAAADSTTDTVELEGIRVGVAPADALSIVVDGVPFTQGAQFWVVNPTWTEHWYSYGLDTTHTKNVHVGPRPGSGQSATFEMRSPDNSFEGTQTVELLPGRRVRIAVDARLTSDLNAVLEHQLGEIVPAWLNGRGYAYVDAHGRKTAGVVPAQPPAYAPKKCTMAKGFRSLTLDTRLGPVEITTTGTAPLTLLDYRSNRYQMGKMVFWFGVFDIPIKRGVRVAYEVEYRFPPARTRAPEHSGSLAAGPRHLEQVLRSAKVADRIIPTPKNVVWGQGTLPVGAGTRVVFQCGNPSDQSFVDSLAQEIVDHATQSMKLQFVRMQQAPAAGSGGTTPSVILNLVSGSQRGAAFKPEGYRITVDSNVLLESDTTAGLVNAVKTLRQLYREEDGKFSVRRCRINDYPSMPFRGVMFFTGKDARAEQVQLVRDVLGALKINEFVYHCCFVDWPSHPELHPRKIGMSFADAKAVVEEAHRQHMQVTPFLPSFGLKEWVRFGDMAYPKAGKPENYDPDDPREVAILQDVIREAIDLCKSRYVLIGHDELSTPTEALLRSIRRWNDFLKPLGQRPMIWGDQFLARGEGTDALNAATRDIARERRAGIPKDTIVCDWHYESAPVEKYVSLKLFNDLGLDAIACPWYEPPNVINFARQAALRHAAGRNRPGEGLTLGLLDTTWAGWNFDRKAMEESAQQVAAYILAAEAAWTGGAVPADRLPFDHMAEFVRIWQKDVLPPGGAPGWSVDLSPLATFGLSGGHGKEWLGYETGDDLASFPTGDQWLGRFRFTLPGTPGNPRAVLLSGRLNPEGDWPSEVTIPIDTTATAVNFAVAATLAASPDPAVARTTISYADGTTESILWRVGQNLYSLDDPRVSAPAPVVWTRKADGKAPFYVHSFTWVNPRPAETIREIRMTSTKAGPGLLLFGMNGTWR